MGLFFRQWPSLSRNVKLGLEDDVGEDVVWRAAYYTYGIPCQHRLVNCDAMDYIAISMVRTVHLIVGYTNLMTNARTI